jgi:hypothetical protein
MLHTGYKRQEVVAADVEISASGPSDSAEPRRSAQEEPRRVSIYGSVMEELLHTSSVVVGECVEERRI